MSHEGVLFTKLVDVAQIDHEVIKCECRADVCVIKEVNRSRGYVVLNCGRSYNIGYCGNLTLRVLREPVAAPDTSVRDVLTNMVQGRRLDDRGDYGLG